jgi:hypothetical protein
MKAAHRKELQTNSLADMLARTVRKARSGGGFSWFQVLVVLAILVVVLGFFWIRGNRAQENAEAWAKVEYNDTKSLVELYKDAKDTRQGQAATFTLGFSLLWDGIRIMGAGDSKLPEGVSRVETAMKLFSELAEECKDDNERFAEAKYHLAVANEALACLDAVKYLGEAKKHFEALTSGDLAATPYGKLAKKRLEQYSDPTSFTDMIVFYSRFRGQTPTLGPGQ